MGEEQKNGKALRLGSTDRRLDANAITQGVRQECPFRPGFAVAILPAASYNPRFRKALQASPRVVVQLAAEDGILSRYDDPTFVVDALVGEMFGITDGEGSAVPYTPEVGVEILGDPSNADVKQWITTEAHRFGLFYAETVEAEAKN